MPVHDWTNVEAGIFHHFHHSWIEEIQRVLNAGLLPPDCYALAEQHAAGFGPDVLTLQANTQVDDALGVPHQAAACCWKNRRSAWLPKPIRTSTAVSRAAWSFVT